MARSFWAAVATVFFILLGEPLFCLAESVRVGIGFTIPPYVIREKDAGLEVDTIREAFRAVGIEVEFLYLPNLRLPLAFADGSVDCVAANAMYDLAGDSGVPVHYSDITVIFQNFAITLQKNEFHITSISDLNGKRVLGFNNAAKFLGGEYATMAAFNDLYSELDDQALQVRMLCSDRVDVVIADKRIFLYWHNQLVKSSNAGTLTLEKEFVFHPIFSPAPRHLGFRDETLRSRFNKGLYALRRAGGIKAIEERYAGVGE